MEKILFITNSEDNDLLSKISLEALNGAINLSREINAQLEVGVIGGNVEGAINSIAGCGASAFYGLSGQEFKNSRYGSDSCALEAVIKASAASLILAPGSSRLMRSLPGAAFRLNGKVDTHINGVSSQGSGVEVTRWYYRQRIRATLSRSERPWVLLIDGGVYEPWQGDSGTANITNIVLTLGVDDTRTEVTGLESPSSNTQTILPDAEALFVAGAGWTKKQKDGNIHIQDAERHIVQFLNLSKASLGSSKSLVDQNTEGVAVLNFMSHLNQVGQTGSTPRHRKGLATCCHGEEPHVVGWRFIDQRRAVNLDASCGWAQGKADVLYVADAFKVMEKVNELLQAG